MISSKQVLNPTRKRRQVGREKTRTEYAGADHKGGPLQMERSIKRKHLKKTRKEGNAHR